MDRLQGEPLAIGTKVVDRFGLTWRRVGPDEMSSFEWEGVLSGTRLSWDEVTANGAVRLLDGAR